MEQISLFFSKTQDDQIEKLASMLKEYQIINNTKLETLHKLHETFNSDAEELKNKYSKAQDELQEIFDKVDEYEKSIEKIERIVENSEKDVSALEEYAYSGKKNTIFYLISGFRLPNFLNKQ